MSFYMAHTVLVFFAGHKIGGQKKLSKPTWPKLLIINKITTLISPHSSLFTVLFSLLSLQIYSPMSLPTIDTIIFDLGNVLINWNPRLLYRKIFDSEDQITDFLGHICTPTFNAAQDAGRSFEEATASLVAQHPRWEAEIRAYYGRYAEQFDGPIHETVAVLEALKTDGRFRLYGLTNWPADSFPWALETFPFINLLEGVVVSGYEKVIKPDPRIYQILFERYSVKPEQAIYTDDSLPNIEAGKALGLHTIHFQTPTQFKQELKTMIGHLAGIR